MFRVGDKVIINKPGIWIIKKGALDVFFDIGDILTIKEIDDTTWPDSNTTTYMIENEKGFTWVDSTEIMSDRILKLKKILNDKN